MKDPWATERQATQRAVFDGPGQVAAELRQAVGRGEGPEDLRVLVSRIHDEPWAVTDEDWASLAPYPEDERFEIVVAAAVGAARYRLDAALAALEGACD